MRQDGFSEHYYQSDDGLRLYARIYGQMPSASRGDPPVVCLPGLSRNSRDFHWLAQFLSSPAGGARTVVCLDYRGRGQSERDSDKGHYTIAVETGDVISACRALGIHKAIFVGTSRGGLILHVLAQQLPSLIAAVVLNDIGPVIELDGLLAIRDYLNRDNTSQSWEQASASLQTRFGAEFPALGQSDWQQMADAIYRDEGGYPIPDFDPAIARQLLTLDGATTLPDLWEAFQALARYPLLLIRGENSRLLSEKTVAEMHRWHDRMISTTAPGQGHAPLLHLNGLGEKIARFIEATTRGA